MSMASSEKVGKLVFSLNPSLFRFVERPSPSRPRCQTLVPVRTQP